MHLMPLVDATWYMSLVQRGIQDDKSLDEIINIIMEESNARNPLHARRMELLRIKNTGSHSDFLYQLEQMSDLIDFKSLTCSSLVMNLFLEQSDAEMAKMCQEILAKTPKGDLALSRQEIKRTESSVWYTGNGKNQAKLAVGRFCPDCNTNTHSKEQCWGVCSICNRRRHHSSECRSNDSNAAAEHITYSQLHRRVNQFANILKCISQVQ